MMFGAVFQGARESRDPCRCRIFTLIKGTGIATEGPLGLTSNLTVEMVMSWLSLGYD